MDKSPQKYESKSKYITKWSECPPSKQKGRKTKRDLQELSHASMLHAIKIYDHANNTFLWPYAIRKAVNDMNLLKQDALSLSPTETFSCTRSLPNMNRFHTFGCPMYVLETKIQGAIKGRKWQS
jgi:hypothetical protein